MFYYLFLSHICCMIVQIPWNINCNREVEHCKQMLILFSSTQRQLLKWKCLLCHSFQLSPSNQAILTILIKGELFLERERGDRARERERSIDAKSVEAKCDLGEMVECKSGKVKRYACAHCLWKREKYETGHFKDSQMINTECGTPWREKFKLLLW